MKGPLSMPETGAAQQEFEPQRVDYSAPEASGDIGGVQAGFPLWAGVWTLGRLGEGRSDEWRSFLAECRGAIRSFYGRDLRRPFPRAHLGGFSRMVRYDGSPFDGSATAWSQSIDADGDCNLTLSGLPSGLTLETVDYVGFKWDASGEGAGNQRRRALVRVVRGGGGIANASGQVTVKVEPAIPTCVPASGTSVAHLDNPMCVMKLVTEQSRLNAIDRSGGIRGGTIIAVQRLRA